MRTIDETHDPRRKSWVTEANESDTDFPIQNLPFCRYSEPGSESYKIGVGIGDRILDLELVHRLSLLPAWTGPAVEQGDLNRIMAGSLQQRIELRRCLSRLLCSDCGDLRDNRLANDALIPQAAARFALPCTIGDYTDFYASIFHATNVGSMFRPDNPLLPNYKYIPIGYHGRGSSLGTSGQQIHRPHGQLPPAADGAAPSFGPCKNLDYELEVGCFVAQGNEWGHAIPLSQCESHLFGIGLVNDWSARDIQRWEYQPLGPFLAKSFATTISPWIVTMEAVEPFRCPVFQRPADDPKPLPYLSDAGNQARGGINLQLEVFLQSEKMRDAKIPPHRLSQGHFTDMYWTFAQMVAHHSSNGCNLNPGDLLASGTVSNRERSTRGCLLELTWDGEIGRPVPGSQRTPIELPSGEQRVFLQDGDTVIMRGRCEAEGFRSIGLGQCSGTILPAVAATE